MPEEKLPSILIAVPCLDSIKTPTVSSLLVATRQLRATAKLHIHQSAYIHDARNKSAQLALDEGADYLMFIDSDMQFPPDGIQRLLDRKKDIIGGLYYRRQAPHLPTINEKNGKLLQIPHEFPTEHPFKIFSVATGFLLVKTDVLRKIGAPWFGFGKFHGKEMGEDVFFCWKANQKGYEVWCDPTIPLGHVGEYIFDEKDYLAYKETRPDNVGTEDLWDGQL